MTKDEGTVDAKLWTVGATLFALFYLTLAITLVWSVVVVTLLLAAWVLGMEVEGKEGQRYVEFEMRPALAFVGIFGLTVVILGPHFPTSLLHGLYPVQYSTPLAVLRATPVLFYFAIVPFITGSLMSVHQRLYPTSGILFQTPPSPSTKVHVHLHTGRSARVSDDDEEEDAEADEEEGPAKVSRPAARPHRLPQLSHRLRRPHQLKAARAASDDDEDAEDEDDAPVPPRHAHRRHPLRTSESAEL